MIRSALFSGLMTILLSSAPAAAEVTVEFVEPKRFTDLADLRADEQRNMNLLEEFFIDAVSDCLAEGERVHLTIHNIDLAGRFEFGTFHPGVRIMREVDVPRIDAEYRLHRADGPEKASDREIITDINYLGRGNIYRGTASRGGQALRYEKLMINRWARKTFCDDQPQRAARQ